MSVHFVIGFHAAATSQLNRCFGGKPRSIIDPGAILTQTKMSGESSRQLSMLQKTTLSRICGSAPETVLASLSFKASNSLYLF